MFKTILPVLIFTKERFFWDTLYFWEEIKQFKLLFSGSFLFFRKELGGKINPFLGGKFMKKIGLEANFCFNEVCLHNIFGLEEDL